MSSCQLEDISTIVLAFCIADISVEALNEFLEDSEDLEYDSCRFQIVDSFDLDLIKRGHNTENPVPIDFCSPFQGWSLQEVKKWFVSNLSNNPRDMFVNHNFIVIDEQVQPIRDEENPEPGNVILCDARTRMFKTVRIQSSMAMSQAIFLDFKSATLRDGSLGVFWRSGTICTEDTYSLVSRNGIYFHKGVPEIDEKWRAFNQEWRQGGPHDFDSSSDSGSEDELQSPRKRTRDSLSQPPKKRARNDL